MLVDTNARDTTTVLFGHKISAPICFAPVGINVRRFHLRSRLLLNAFDRLRFLQKIYHPLGELNSAKVAGELGLPYCLSTASSQSIEDVAQANGANAVRFFQLYSPPDEELLESILQRAIVSIDVLVAFVTLSQVCLRFLRTMDSLHGKYFRFFIRHSMDSSQLRLIHVLLAFGL